jgi:hypothetical protein
MPVVLVLALVCEAELTVTAAALGVAMRPARLLIPATVAAALGAALAVYGIWALWFVGPACVVGGAGCALPPSSLAYLGLGASAQWLWMLAIALGARFATGRPQKSLSPGA